MVSILGLAAIAAAAATVSADSGYTKEKRQATSTTISPDCAIVQAIFGDVLTNRTVTEDCCASRAYFTCNGDRPRRIVSIDMNIDVADFEGTLPSSIGQLTALTWLSLHGRKAYGTIPTEIGNLVRLNVLDLGLNRFSGPIPTEIGNMKALTDVYLNNMQLSGSIPSELGSLPLLELLTLSNNSLTGTIPSELLAHDFKYAKKGLFLDTNQFTGPVPQPNFAGQFKASLNCFDGVQGTDRNTECKTPFVPGASAPVSSDAGGSKVSPGQQQNPSPPAQSGPNLGAIIGGALGGLAVIALIVFGVLHSKKRKEPVQQGIQPASYEAENAKYGATPGAGTQAFALPPKYVDPTTVAPSSRGSFMPPYAASESGLSSGSNMDGSARVDQYRVLGDQSSKQGDVRSSVMTSGTEKLSEKSKMGGSNAPSSFLDSQLASSTRVNSQLDEKMLLRGSAVAAGVAVMAARPEAGPLPGKDSYHSGGLQTSNGSTTTVIGGRDQGALPEKDPLLAQMMSGGAGSAATQSNNPTGWSVEQCASWASKIDKIGGNLAASIKEHNIDGKLLLKLTREDMRTDFGLNVGDRILFEREIIALRRSAGISDVTAETEAALPPSYHNISY